MHGCYVITIHYIVSNDKSMNNIIISDLTTLLSDYSLCSGVNSFGSNITRHVIQKVFNIDDTSPTQEITIVHILAC